MRTNKIRKVSKLVSLDPTRYKEIRLDEATKGYQDYLECYHVKMFHGDTDKTLTQTFNYDSEIKDFLTWLETEI